MPSPYKPLVVTPGYTESGVADKIFIASVSDFTTIETVDASGVEIPNSHAFKVGFGFVEVPCAVTKNSLGLKSVGEPGSIKGIKKLETVFTGSKSELHQLINQVKNDQLIILVPDVHCATPQFYQLGSNCVAAYLSEYEFTSGTTKEGMKGYKVTFEFPANAMQLYLGALTLHP